jgi:hypothetical protein
MGCVRMAEIQRLFRKPKATLIYGMSIYTARAAVGSQGKETARGRTAHPFKRRLAETARLPKRARREKSRSGHPLLRNSNRSMTRGGRVQGEKAPSRRRQGWAGAMGKEPVGVPVAPQMQWVNGLGWAGARGKAAVLADAGWAGCNGGRCNAAIVSGRGE